MYWETNPTEQFAEDFVHSIQQLEEESCKASLVKPLQTYSFGCSYILLCMHIMHKTTENFTGTNIFKLGIYYNILLGIMQFHLWCNTACGPWIFQHNIFPLINANTPVPFTHILSHRHTTSTRFHSKQQDFRSVLLAHSTLLKVTVEHGFTSNIISVCNSLCHTILILQIWAVNCPN